MTPPPVVITGVSSGIGRAIASAFVRRGMPVFGSVRTAADATAFEEALGPLARSLVFDLRDRTAIVSVAEQVGRMTDDRRIAALINNAGPVLPGPLEQITERQFDEQIDTSLKGTLAVIQAFLTLLKGPPPGRIVNISSVAGATTMPFLGAYSIAKHGIEAMSDALRRELRVYGIDVVVVQPGGVRTPIWGKADRQAAADAFQAYQPSLDMFRTMALRAGETGLAADEVAERVCNIIASKRPRARYLISPHPITERLTRVLPTRLLDGLIARRLRLWRRD